MKRYRTLLFSVKEQGLETRKLRKLLAKEEEEEEVQKDVQRDSKETGNRLPESKNSVRRFFKEKALRFVKINVDVFVEWEKDLRERTGSVTVLKIFFDERLIGGLVELNALRKNGDEELERRLTTPVGEGPLAPMYGFDEATEVEEAAVATYVRHHGCAPSKVR
ncbi:hypothetical protein D0Y65_021833 [Glycine soja]|uniref:Uncharacterized protein n=1 Tax=Glycine soja TaxID=3848 RepID=A0A445JL29_GLYSO|nr:hypothetical protein D0Y65_021833 [Glycine soja]